MPETIAVTPGALPPNIPLASALDVAADHLDAARTILSLARGRFLRLSGSDADSQADRDLVDGLENATHDAADLCSGIRGLAGAAHELEVPAAAKRPPCAHEDAPCGPAVAGCEVFHG